MAGLKEHIFLIGFMGCGKSTNAACLAEMTGARQVEMDQMIVENEGMAIADIFKEKGEPYFRELETDLIKSFVGVEPAVISCGGRCCPEGGECAAYEGVWEDRASHGRAGDNLRACEGQHGETGTEWEYECWVY